MASARRDPLIVNQFHTLIDGVKQGAVHKVEGLRQSCQVIKSRSGTDKETHYHPGRLEHGEIVVTKDIDSTDEFSTWRDLVNKGNTDRRPIAIEVWSRNKRVGTYELFECHPIGYKIGTLSASNSGHATEQLTIAFEKLRYKHG